MTLGFQWRFYHRALAAFLLLCGGFLGLNVLTDEFGLWGVRQTVRIWQQERMSKYLLAQRYVPENFDRLLVGPSYSNNLDPRGFHRQGVYNLSVDGANIAEIKRLLLTATEQPGAIREVLFCLHPYLFRSSHLQTNQMDERFVWRSVFSSLPLELQWWKIKDAHGLGNPRFAHSGNGYSDYSAGKPLKPFAEFVQEQRERFALTPPKLQWQREAVGLFAELLDVLRERGVHIGAYYYPMYREFHEHWVNAGAWTKFKADVEPLFLASEVRVDFNDAAYRWFTSDMGHYVDTHLNPTGAANLVELLDKTYFQ